MRRFGVLVASLCLLSGCTQLQLRKTTTVQASTISELQTQQILDNLAHFCADPEAVPSFAVPAGGVVNVQDQINGNIFINYTRVILDKYGGQVGGSHTVTGNWSMAPINDPDRLRMMRCLYQHVVCYVPPCAGECYDCEQRLRQFFGDEFEKCNAPRGWYGCGKKCDVPLGAKRVGHWGKTYVWVLPGGEHGLTTLTLSVLDVCTALRIISPPPSREVTSYEYNAQGQLVKRESRNVAGPRQRTEELPISPREAGPPPDRTRDRMNFFDPSRGLFFVPRD